jgi:hypothetical protein
MNRPVPDETAEWRQAFADVRKDKTLTEWHPLLDRFEPLFFDFYACVVRAASGEAAGKVTEDATSELSAATERLSEIVAEVISSPLRTRFELLPQWLAEAATEEQLNSWRNKHPQVLWSKTRIYRCPT